MKAAASRDIGQLHAAIIGLGFIGGVHVDALRRLGVTVGGVLTSDPERAARSATRWNIGHVYPGLDEVCADETIDVVHVTSPNYLHAPQALALLAAGKHVVCEKPLALTVDDGERMAVLAREQGLVNALCFNSRYYPAVQHARTLVRDGTIGAPRLITGSYLQDWLMLDTDWSWRLDAAAAGPLRAISDIGSHWLDLVQFVTGLRITEVLADLHTVMPVRRRPSGAVESFAARGAARDLADDNRYEVRVDSEDVASLLLRFEDGTSGSLIVSQVSPGRKNALRFEIAGSRAGIAWDSEENERLWIGHRDRPNEVLIRDPALLGSSAGTTTRLPGGHPEGFADGFLGLMSAVYADIVGLAEADAPPYPRFADGLTGLRIEDAVIRSNEQERWASV